MSEIVKFFVNSQPEITRYFDNFVDPPFFLKTLGLNNADKLEKVMRRGDLREQEVLRNLSPTVELLKKCETAVEGGGAASFLEHRKTITKAMKGPVWNFIVLDRIIQKLKSEGWQTLTEAERRIVRAETLPNVTSYFNTAYSELSETLKEGLRNIEAGGHVMKASSGSLSSHYSDYANSSKFISNPQLMGQAEEKILADMAKRANRIAPSLAGLSREIKGMPLFLGLLIAVGVAAYELHQGKKNQEVASNFAWSAVGSIPGLFLVTEGARFLFTNGSDAEDSTLESRVA